MAQLAWVIPILIVTVFPLVFADDEQIKTVSTSKINSYGPTMTIDGNNIFLIWVESSSYSGSPQLFFSKSTDGGETFSDPVQILDKKGSSIGPELVSEGQNLILTWTYRFPDEQNSDIYFSKSPDGGETFSSPLLISDEKKYSPGQSMAVDGKNIFVAWPSNMWEGNYQTNSDIFFSKSTDEGETFSEPKNLTNDDGLSSGPIVETDGKNIFVAWSNDFTWSASPDYLTGDAVFFSKSTDGGETFSEPKNLSAFWRYSNNPSIASDGSNIFMTWRSDGGDKEDPEVYFSKSIDGGDTFAEPKKISIESGYASTQSIKTDGKNIFVTWASGNEKSRHVMLSKSSDGGENFSPPEVISSKDGFSDSQEMIINGTDLLFTWEWAQKIAPNSGRVQFLKMPFDQSSIENNLDEKKDESSTSNVFNETSTIKENNEPGILESSVKEIHWIHENGANYAVGGIGVIRLDDSNLNVNKTLIDIPIVHVWSDTDMKGIPVDIIETGADTGVFYADINLSGSESDHLQINVSDGDRLTVSFEDEKSGEIVFDSIKIKSKYFPPLKQLEQHVQVDKITCMDSHKLFIKENVKPLCIKETTYVKLLERGYFS